MYNGYFPVIADVGMGVYIIRLPMGGPSGMAYADETIQILVF